MRRPAAGRKDRDTFVSGKTKQNAVKTMVLTSADGRVLFCSPVRPGSCADITQARHLGLTQLLADGPFSRARSSRSSCGKDVLNAGPDLPVALVVRLVPVGEFFVRAATAVRMTSPVPR